MRWEVEIPGDDTGTQPWACTVEADNWFSALRGAVSKKGGDGGLVSNVTCDIKPDRSVHVTDFVSRKVFVLRVVEDPVPEEPATASPEPRAVADEIETPVEPGIPTDLPPHEVFFRRDDSPADGSGIFYRERLVEVSPEVHFEEAGRLALAVFERLRDLGASEGTKLFVIVQIFDHSFDQRSKRPPVAALSWKEWSPRKCKVEYPLSGAPGLTVDVKSRVSRPGAGSPPMAAPIFSPAKPAPVEPSLFAQPAPAPTTAPAPTPTPAAEQPVDLVPREATPAPVPAPAAAPVPEAERPVEKSQRRPTPAPMKAAEAGIEDRVVMAFERMHELYSVREHDEAARFALNLSRDFIECEAGSAMLITPGKYELYIAAAAGPVADELLGRKMSLTKGIIGFATRTSAVVTVSDPARDPRFHEEFDSQSGFVTRNVVCAPIQHEGRTIGAIELINCPRTSGFLQSEANVLSYIAGAVGEYIDTSLPSREADFSDKEFMEFIPQKRSPAAGGKKAAPAKGSPAKPPAKAGDRPTAAASAKEGGGGKKQTPKSRKKRKR